MTTRFAPSPTGLLHLGHAYSALLNFDHAQKSGGRFVLRIEDIDQGRCRPPFETAILRDLDWLGIKSDVDVLRQSDRFMLYQDILERLAARGLLYRCFRTRRELSAIASAPHGPQGEAPGPAPLPREEEERLLSEGAPFAWRLHMQSVRAEIGETVSWVEIVDNEQCPRSASLSDLPDEILGRKDFPASYHLASVVDDAAQGVDLVWRGEDLRDAIPVHRVLQTLLGLPAPFYRHHRLITDETGRRLAKRDHDATLAEMREHGVTPAGIRQRLGLPPAA